MSVVVFSDWSWLLRFEGSAPTSGANLLVLRHACTQVCLVLRMPEHVISALCLSTAGALLTDTASCQQMQSAVQSHPPNPCFGYSLGYS
jgi:hypothetical protein